MGFFDEDIADTQGGFFGAAELPVETPGDEGQDDVPDFVRALGGTLDQPETVMTEAGLAAQGATTAQTIGKVGQAVSPMIGQFKAGLDILPQIREQLETPTLRSEREFRKALKLSKEQGTTLAQSFKVHEEKTVAEYRTAIEDYKLASAEIAGLRPEETGQAFLFDVLTMAEQMVPSLAVAGLTGNPNAGLATMFGQVYVNSLVDVAASNPELDASQVRTHAVVRAGIETVTEKLPFDILLKKVGWSGVKKMLGFTVAEGLQEGASSLLQSAWDKGTINPDLTLGETLRNAGYETLLGIAGAPIVAAPFIMRDQIKQARKEEAFFETFGDTQENILRQHQGPQVPKALRALITEKQELERKLREAGEQAGETTLADGTPAPLDYTIINDSQIGEENSQFIQNIMYVRKVDGEVEKVSEVDWTQEQVKVADSTHYSDLVQSLESGVGELRGILQVLAPQMEELRPLMEQSLQYKEQQLAYYQNLRNHELQVEQQAHGLLTDWVRNFMPDGKIIFSTTHAGEATGQLHEGYDIRGSEDIVGHHWQFANEVSVLELNLDALTDENGVLKEGRFVDTLSHEFGHALINTQFKKQTNEVKKGLVAAYQKWLKDVSQSDLTIAEFLQRRKGVFGAQSVAAKQGQKILDTKVGDLEFENASYQFGITEFVADQLAKGTGAIEKLNAPLRRYFRETGEFLKAYYKSAKQQYQIEGSYKDFLDYLGVKATIDRFQISEAQLQEEFQNRTYDQQVQDKLVDIAKQIIPPGKDGGYDSDDFSGDLDRFSLGSRFGLTLLQLRKRNGHIKGLRDYTSVIKAWWNTKMQWASQADERLKQWQKLGSKRGEAFGRFLLDLTVLSDEQGRRLTPQDDAFQELVSQYKLGNEALALYDLVDQDFRMVLTELEEALIRDAQRNFAENPDQMALSIAEIQKEMEELKNSNFFPLSRFGQFYVRVTALRPQITDGKEFVLGDITSFETFETKKAMKKRLAELGKSKKQKAVGGKMNDMQRQFAGFPPQFISMLKNRLNLTEAQDAEMSKLLHDLAPGQSFKKHLKNRKNVAGYSMDAMRGYANYFMHFSNHVARIKYKFDLLDAIDEVKKSAEIVRTKQGEATKRDEITEYLNRHYEYIMNPGDEWANLRALGFLWYLGFVPKSAVVNLTQVPLVTLPYLGARFGDAKAVSALTKATKNSKDYWLNPQRLSQGQHAMLHALKKSGIIDESIATELAGVSEGSLLQRTLPGTFLKSERAARWIRTGAGYGAWMFQQAEKLNRRITAIAAYNLSIEEGLTHEVAVAAAQEAVESTQFEYARWNRPEFMRDKKSVLFLFWQYMQNSLFFVATDPGAKRYMLMLFLLAGLGGLPGAEDFMDLFDFLNKKINKATGAADRGINVRADLREMFQQLGMNPDLMMHGSSRYMFGAPQVADLVGIPLPNVDMSGSLSMGRIIPGVEPVLGREGRAGDTLSRAGEEVGGAVLAMPINMMRAIIDDNPNTLKRFERAMPSFAKNLSKAYRYATEGDRLHDGSQLVEFDLNDSKHQIEIWAQAMGFAPTRAQIAKEKYYITKEIAEYYELRRRSLLKAYDYARQADDTKMEQKVLQEISKFNDTLPFAGFSLSGKDISRSLKNRERKRAMNEAGFFVDKKAIEVIDYVDSAFPEESSEESRTATDTDSGFFTEEVK